VDKQNPLKLSTRVESWEMADPDPSISNGTCVYARGKRATRNFIPCGNAVFGDIHCCQAGDNCLEDNACYNSKHGTTYLAGCTDFDYDDPSCPNKKSYDGMTLVLVVG
jgi:hypothetical protein